MGGFARRHPLAAYFALAYAWTWTLGAPVLAAGRGWIGAVPHWLEPVAAFGPFVAAMLVARLVGGRPAAAAIIASLGNYRVPPHWLAIALLGPPVLLGLGWIGLTAAGQSPVDPASARPFTLVGLADLVIVSGLVQGLAEEPGWRGFAQPRLRERFGPLGATLALYPFWLFWHAPFFLARPQFGVGEAVAFAAGILSAALWLGWIYERTRSLLMAAGWHALVNVCRGIALACSTALFLTVSTLVLVGAVLIAGWWLWRRPGPAPAAAAPVITP